MRGADEAKVSLFSHVDLKPQVPARDPLRKFRCRRRPGGGWRSPSGGCAYSGGRLGCT